MTPSQTWKSPERFLESEPSKTEPLVATRPHTAEVRLGYARAIPSLQRVENKPFCRTEPLDSSMYITFPRTTHSHRSHLRLQSVLLYLSPQNWHIGFPWSMIKPLDYAWC